MVSTLNTTGNFIFLGCANNFNHPGVYFHPQKTTPISNFATKTPQGIGKARHHSLAQHFQKLGESIGRSLSSVEGGRSVGRGFGGGRLGW